MIEDQYLLVVEGNHQDLEVVESEHLGEVLGENMSWVEDEWEVVRGEGESEKL